MIYGKGYFFNKLNKKSYNRDKGLFIYAIHERRSNYSNSFFEEQCILLKKKVNDSKLIYFSSCSIYDKSLLNTEYIQYNLKMESYIIENFEQYLIFRLPTLVSKISDNSLVSYLNEAIQNEIEIKVFDNASRYLIDIDDVIELVFEMSHQENEIINLVITDPYKIIDIIHSLNSFCKKNLKITYLNKGNFYNIRKIKTIDSRHYLKKILLKYYGNQV